MFEQLITIFSTFWFIRTLKAVLFWVYLWQLKEYQVSRFVDHFRTHKGKKLIFGALPLVKLLLLILLLVNYYFFDFAFYILLVLYIIESLSLIKGFKKPVFTFKTILLTGASSLLTVAYFTGYSYGKPAFWLVFSVLLFDILAPLFITMIVLLFQPFFVIGRNNVLRKAKKKIAGFNELLVIGVTGSYGKTSTKEFLTTMLSEKFNVLSTSEHRNSEMGIAKTILEDLNKKHQIFIVEMGAYRKGGISLLCDMVKPNIGLVTGVNQQHLALFGSMENLLSAEGGQELVQRLPKNGLLVVNGDNKYCLELYKKTNINKRLYTVGKGRVASDIFAEELTVHEKALDFLAITKNKETAHFNVPVLGKQNVQNLLGAMLVARELGMSFNEIASGTKKIKQEQAGITLQKGIHKISIVDSSYSSNPDGAMADLDYLNVFKGKKVVVMPCLIELGEKSAEIHREIGKKIANICDLAIIVTKDYFQAMKAGALDNGMKEGQILFFDKPKEIFNKITTTCKEGDVILLEGRVSEGLIKLLNDK